MQIVEQIISALLPMIIKELEKIVNSSPDASQAWITGMVNEIVSFVSKVSPSWLIPTEQELGVLIADLLSKVMPK